LGKGNIIGPYTCIGTNGEIRGVDPKSFEGYVHIGNNNIISELVTIQRPFKARQVTYLGNNNIVMAHAHFGHDVSVGDNCEICTSVVLGGYTIIGNNTKIKLHSVIRNRLDIGKNVTVGMGSVVLKDIPNGETWFGNPAKRYIKEPVQDEMGL